MLLSNPKTSFIPYNQKLITKAKENRKNPTPAEKKMWYEILNSNKTGYRFLRQKPISNFILDFYCPKLLLAIEIDGDTHAQQVK
ncbi:endonuclease, partial [Candidatus Peregrinibacteria bacterium CG08_land_8_20_14_0_20_41_10]